MPEELFKILIKYYSADSTSDKPKKIAQLTNLSHLRKMSNNDERFVKDMIDSFITNTPVILKDLEKAKAEQHWEDVGSLAHKLKPNLAFMGIDTLKELVLHVETSGKKAENLEQLPGDVDKLISKVDEAIKELSSL